MKYTHDMRDFVKDRATIGVVCSLENIRFNSSKKADCPICGKKANFTIKENINHFKCWSCDASGDAIDLYSKLYGLDFKESVIALAGKLGYIENEIQLERLKPVVKAEPKVVVKKELTEAQADLYNNVYEILSEVCGITPADAKLVSDRGMKTNKKKDFFSFRGINDVKLGKLIQNCASRYSYTKEDIAKVPGFYIENGALKLKKLYGLALKARNHKGQVVGIQVRTEFEDSKYLWLSSENVGGVGCGTPVSVEYPLNVMGSEKMNIDELIENSNATVFITEGKFKGCTINQEFNSIAITLAGINNWRGRVEQELDYVNSKKEIKNIMLAFDADMCYNFIIEEQPRKMMKEELSKYMDKNVRVAVWDIRYGKGIDDVINGGFRSKLKSIPAQEFWDTYEEFVKHCNKLWFNKDDKAERTALFNQYFNL